MLNQLNKNMTASKKILLVIALVFTGIFVDKAQAQDIGIFSEPAPKKKPVEKPPVRKPTPRKTEKPDNNLEKAVEKVKSLFTLTVISDPIECEVYINDVYRGTTSTANGKLIIPDLDPKISYNLRIYKRGIGEDLQSLQLTEDKVLNLSLTQVAKTSDPLNKVDENTTNNTTEVKKEPDKQPDKELNKEADTTSTNNSTTPPTTVNPPKPITPPQREMVFIPAGDTVIGVNAGAKNNTARPQHKVSIPGFYMDVYEVTNEDYKLFCDATNRVYPTNPAWDKNYFLDKPNHPAINVSWEDANAYAAWVGKRLPTEEEWEKAARGPEARIWPWGKDYQPNLSNLSGKEDGFETTAPVGSLPSGVSPYGLQDTIGNVWEWTSSRYIPYPGAPLIDDERLNKENFRVIRGGGYNTPSGPPLNATFRFPGEIGKTYEATGFRCAK
ncbi:MAG: formylglycine-generating enzyme family protein [Blastocatellia bacterium]|nr:formylglycine-generating enzyme family protein [Blastocatellia bacterium]